jgi:CubicO group peptidase (beta-lactamase class C family)/transglutaminase-like putative cysteine protease
MNGMNRGLKILLILTFILTLAGTNLLAQDTGLDPRWKPLNEELTRAYEGKDWPASLAVLDRMMKLADETKNAEARVAILYMRGCVHSRAGEKAPALEALRASAAAGFMDYDKISSDPDLNPLRAEPGFKSLLAELKAKYGPVPIEWDRSRPAPAFAVTYDDPADPRLAAMRREFGIDAAVAGAKDDLDRLIRLARWVSGRWEHSPNQVASKPDPVTILREAQKGGRFICRDYAIVMAGVAAAYGLPARVVNLLPRDVETRSESHSVAEVWLGGLQKWVLADGQYGAVGELAGLPLNAVELQAAFVADEPVTCSAGDAVLAGWKPFILRNAYYFKTGDDQRAFDRRTSRQLVLVPKGAAEPHKFAGANEEVFTGAIYTSNPDSFYAAPAGRDALAAELIKGLETGLPAWIKQGDVPGVAVAVVDDKRILWQGVYGFTSRAKDRPVTPRTLFSIQSMSKSFTALGVLMAVQDGLLDLDRPITEYLPGFTVHSRFEADPEGRMTLRHLLSHKAGFAHEAPVGGNFDSRPHTFAEHIRSISDIWLRYPVGYRYSYSNLGIDLAGYILEKKSGLPFARYIHDKVLAPIGMTESTLDIEAILKAEDRALGNTSPTLKVAGGIPVEIPMVPAGGVYTNILDMSRYLMFHINEGGADQTQILRPDLIKTMHTVQFPEERERFGYGLGITTNHLGPEVYYQHGGGGYGFISTMAMYPGLKLGIVALTNSDQNSVVGPILELMSKLIEARLPPPGPEYDKPTVGTGSPLPAGDGRVKRLACQYTSDVTVGAGKDGVFGIAIGKQFYPLTFYEDPAAAAGEKSGATSGAVIGVFGKYSELREKPPLREGQPGTLVHLNRLSGTCLYYDFIKPGSSMDKPGPNKPEWKPYLGLYPVLYWGRAYGVIVAVGLNNGYLTANGMRCHEYLPGLFFTADGEALDFRGTVATFRNILLIRTSQ